MSRTDLLFAIKRDAYIIKESGWFCRFPKHQKLDKWAGDSCRKAANMLAQTSHCYRIRKAAHCHSEWLAGCGRRVPHANKGNANDRSVQNVFSRSALNVSRAAPSSFSFFFTSKLFSSANFSCQLSLRELGLVRSLRKWFQWHFPLGVFRFLHGNQQGQSVSHGSFIDFEFQMIKAAQIYSYLVPYISPFLPSKRMSVGFRN